MHYRIASSTRYSHYLDVECQLTHITTPTIDFQLPSWRPGRYELQHFAKNIQRFEIVGPDNRPVPFCKVTKDRWQVQTEGLSTITARYTYYAATITAGTSYTDSQLLYVNPVNLCLYAEGRLLETCTLELAIPEAWTIACGLQRIGPTTLQATDFYQLADCPLMASPSIQHLGYEVKDVRFHIWIYGTTRNLDRAPSLHESLPHKQLLDDFKCFTEVQWQLFGEFPEHDYHFLTLLLPTAFYHGVEHRNSTMLVLGPNDESEGLYSDLLGLASHELFHAWNVIRIRPKELLPYDFTKENYFPTCFIAEGITTYYGDLLLYRSGVFDEATYLKELLVLLKRHFEGSNHAFQSLTEASWDLWLDGYDKGVPDRKVSVYHKGALTALILDLHIRQKTNHTRSLDDVMRRMWERFGKPFVGYTLDDYRSVTEDVAGERLDWYYDRCIFGNEPLQDLLNDYLAFVGLHLEYAANGSTSVLLHQYDDHSARLEREKWLSNSKV